MKRVLKQFGVLALALTLMVQFTSCEAISNTNKAQRGAAIGATGGAILGAILGNNVGKGGNSELGAVIGGVVGGSAGAIIGNKMDKQAQKIEEEIPGATVERVDDGIVVTFDENSGVYFDTNLAELKPESIATLNKLAAVLVEYPDTNVLVVGHTDSTGPRAFNMTLSEKRAMSVTNYFVHTKGLGNARFTTKWFGPDNPIADNGTVEGRSKNRRVNVVILPNEKMQEDAKREAGE